MLASFTLEFAGFVFAGAWAMLGRGRRALKSPQRPPIVLPKRLGEVAGAGTIRRPGHSCANLFP